MASLTKPDWQEARRFVELLSGKRDPVVCIQTFDDTAKDDFLAEHRHGRLSDRTMQKWIIVKAKAGCGVYIAINETDGMGRSRTNVTNARACAVDLDKKPLPKAFPLPPSIVVQSSPGRHWLFFIIDPTDDLNAWSDCQARLAAYYGGDPSIIDPPRVCRLPGFDHQKADPFRSRIIEANDFEKYTLAEVADAHPCDYSAPSERAEGGRSDEPEAGWDAENDLTRARAYLTTVESPTEGDRNNAGYRVACALNDFGIAPETSFELMTEIWNPRLDDPLPDHEIRHVIKSAGRYKSSSAGSKSAVDAADEFDDAPVTDAEEFDFENSTDEWPRQISYSAKDGAIINAKKFLRRRPRKIIFSNGMVYELADGLWREIDADALASEIQRTNFNDALDVGGIVTMIGAIKIHTYTTAKPFEWIEPPEDAPDPADLIPFANGLLDFKLKKLWPYDGRYFATGRPAFEYEPDADCPRWQQALDEWFEESSDARATMVETVQEFFGYALTPDTRHHVIFALLGAGRAGKSTIVNILEQLTGAMHSKSRVLSDLGGPHGLQGLEDARLLIIPDAADANLSGRSTALSRIKAISGGDTVSINPKNQKPFEIRVPARIVMVANRHPKFLDESGALAMRELPIMFTRSFDGDMKKDPDLGAKLRAELPGIANWAMAGLARLRKIGRFTEGDALRAARSDIESQQSHMAGFAKECLNFKAGESVTRQAMFDAYEAWAAYSRIASREQRNREEFKADLLASAARHRLQLKQAWVNGKNGGLRWINVELNEKRLERIRGYTISAEF